jgi:hypothetical protein
MPEFDPATSMTEVETQTAAIFNVVAGGVAARNLTSTGFIYRRAVVAPLQAVSEELRERHGLTRQEVVERVKKASELVMAAHEHIEPMVPENPTVLGNDMVLGNN